MSVPDQLLRLCRAHVYNLPLQVLRQVLPGEDLDCLEQFEDPAHLDALKGDFELEGVLEVAGVVEDHHVADMNLGHAAEQADCTGKTSLEVRGDWKCLAKVPGCSYMILPVATRHCLATEDWLASDDTEYTTGGREGVIAAGLIPVTGYLSSTLVSEYVLFSLSVIRIFFLPYTETTKHLHSVQIIATICYFVLKYNFFWS